MGLGFGQKVIIGTLDFVMENKRFSLNHEERPNWQCEAIGLLMFSLVELSSMLKLSSFILCIAITQNTDC